MPGIFGLTKKTDNQGGTPIELSLLNIHTDELYHRRKDYSNDRISNSIVLFDFMQDYQFHYQTNDLEIWVYGDPLIDGYTGAKAIEQAVKIVSDFFPDFSKIAAVDGLFNIVIFNNKTNRLYLLGDRNGLCHLYFGVFNGQLIWASELRALLIKPIKKTIRRESFQTFLELGYLIGDTTWYNEIKLLPPASCLEWDVANAELKNITSYWSHKLLTKKTTSKSENEIVTDIAALFANAVKKRVGAKERVGITLSGGQDSRAIFANIPYQKDGFTAITRGIKGCGDIKLASKTTILRKDCTHIIHEINENHWLTGRTDAVTATSGQKDFLNMNAMLSLPVHKKYFDINLDGSEGSLLKGECLNLNHSDDLQTLKEKKLKNIFNNGNTLNELLAYYEQVGSNQYFFMYENIRRFSVLGSILGHDYGVLSRFPILDHQLQEYLYQLPEKNNIGKLWNRTLIKYFPEYFINIDNLVTGSRLFASKKLNFLMKVLTYARGKAGFEKYRLKYHNYHNWISRHDKGLMNKYVLPENLNLYNYVESKPLKNAIEHFLKTGENLNVISRIISLSIFLEQAADD